MVGFKIAFRRRNPSGHGFACLVPDNISQKTSKSRRNVLSNENESAKQRLGERLMSSMCIVSLFHNNVCLLRQ